MKVAMSSLLFSHKTLAESLQFIHGAGIKHVDIGAQQGWCHITPGEGWGFSRKKGLSQRGLFQAIRGGIFQEMSRMW